MRVLNTGVVLLPAARCYDAGTHPVCGLLRAARCYDAGTHPVCGLLQAPRCYDAGTHPMCGLLRAARLLFIAFYIALFSALEQTQCAHVACDSVNE